MEGYVQVALSIMKLTKDMIEVLNSRRVALSVAPDKPEKKSILSLFKARKPK